MADTHGREAGRKPPAPNGAITEKERAKVLPRLVELHRELYAIMRWAEGAAMTGCVDASAIWMRTETAVHALESAIGRLKHV